MEKVFARVRFSSPLSVAVARTSQSPFPLVEIAPKLIFEMKFVKLFFSKNNFVSFYGNNERLDE